MNPRQPVYIVSKGRWQPERGLTTRYLHRMGVPHYIVVEGQERKDYEATAGPLATILTLDPEYQRTFDTCDPALDDRLGPGSGPPRNFAWDHAKADGFPWYWCMDDNIRGFYRLTRNRKYMVTDGTILRAMEDFVDRYENVAMAGPNYDFFAPARQRLSPFEQNTRIYSCNLIRTDLPYRWRCRFNEDTDLSLRMLKDGWCTILFWAFLAKKAVTQSVSGGYAEIYREFGTIPKTEVLLKLHPDVTRMFWRYGRWHHYVDYTAFRRNKLRLKPGVVIPDEPNEYGMKLERRTGDEWRPADEPTYRV